MPVEVEDVVSWKRNQEKHHFAEGFVATFSPRDLSRQFENLRIYILL